MRTLVLILLFSLPTFLFAQTDYQFGFMPTINYNHTYENELGVNAASEFRFSDDFHFLRNATSLQFSKKLNFKHSFVAGYEVIPSSQSVRHRLKQSLNFNRKYTAFRLAHRFSTDQTFQEEESAQFRLRYRLTSQFTLNGLELNENEKYLKLSGELLNKLQDDTYELELRVAPSFGYYANRKNKLEVAPNFRFKSILQRENDAQVWVVTKWYLSD